MPAQSSVLCELSVLIQTLRNRERLIIYVKNGDHKAYFLEPYFVIYFRPQKWWWHRHNTLIHNMSLTNLSGNITQCCTKIPHKCTGKFSHGFIQDLHSMYSGAPPLNCWLLIISRTRVWRGLFSSIFRDTLVVVFRKSTKWNNYDQNIQYIDKLKGKTVNFFS